MSLVLIFVFALFTSSSLNTVDASSKEKDRYTLFEETVTLENKRTKVDVGFVTVEFKKNFLPNDMYPITFEIKLYAEDGKVYIEFSPDVDEFLKDVVVKVHPYDGYIYDVGIDEYIHVDIPKLKMKLPHFSRWCFVW
jgi:hypothetical protein